MPTRPRDPRAIRSRRRVLEVAANVLLEEGPDAFTVDKVVTRSGVARTTIYRHWPTHTALLLDAFRTAAPDRGAPDIPPGSDPIAALERTMVHFARDFRGAAWAGIMPALLEMAARHPELDAIREEHAESRRRHLVSLLEAAVHAGQLDAQFDRAVAVAQLMGPLAFRSMLSHEPVTDRFARTIVHDFVQAHRRTPPTDPLIGAASEHEPGVVSPPRATRR